MSLYNFFTKIGTVNYNNEIVTNIITSVRFKDVIKDKINNFYPYTIKEGDRPDTIAANYYEDSRYAWVVYLSNSIIDPYYEWPLSVNEFNKFLIKKYGSVERSINNVAFYRNAWYKDDSVLTVSGYNALSSSRKKYWNPVTGFNGAITSYERKREDYIAETNKVIQVNVSSTTGFIIGERVTQRTSGNISATGFIKAIDSTKLVINHINGEFLTTGGSVSTILGTDSNSARSVTSASTIYEAIPVDEIVYWEAVSSYDYENELNESRKNIKLIDRQYLDIIEDQMIELLS
jgi:hypothetical protein